MGKRFNWAAAVGRRIVACILLAGQHVGQASIGPPPLGDGSQETAMGYGLPLARFNWAAAVGRRIVGDHSIDDVVNLASIGPPPLGDGSESYPAH